MSSADGVIVPANWQSLVQFGVADAAIAELSEQYMPLRVDGLEDSKGLAVVHEARMVVKNLRVQVEKKRKELKADSLEYGRAVDGEAKRITALLAPIEEHLNAQEQAVLDEKARIKREAEERKAVALQVRMDALAAVGSYPVATIVEGMDDERFAQFLGEATATYQECKRINEAEAERQRVERERLEAEQRKLEEERAALEAERAEIEKAKRQAEQAELSRIAEEAKALASEAERVRVEALRPDLERLASVADLLSAIEVPTVSPPARSLRLEVVNAINDAISRIRQVTAP